MTIFVDSNLSPERVWAEEDTESGEHTVKLESQAVIGHFRPGNDGGFVCQSEFTNDTFTATNELEAVQKIHAAYIKAKAEKATVRG